MRGEHGGLAEEDEEVGGIIPAYAGSTYDALWKYW